jgi:hypothetical protein
MKEYTPFLSKSRFIRGLQCHKSLWLYTHHPEMQDEVSASQQAIFDAGTSVGILAQDLFPGGVVIPYDGLSVAEQLTLTQDKINSGATTIYEAAFSFDNVFVKVDILHQGSKGWELYEVKGSTGVKEVYLNDIAVQYHVVSGAGLAFDKAALVHIDNSYVRQGAIDVQGLFAIQDVTAEIRERQSFVVEEIRSLQTMLLGDMPAIEIGTHCSDPYACSFRGQCWAHLPYPSVFDFADLGKPDPFALYEQGIVGMQDVPRETLSWRQQLQFDGTLQQKSVFDRTAIKDFLESLWYPLAFMDFETTWMTPVPLFDGTWPFQSVPFQYSLHWQDVPDGVLQHREFLAAAAGDPQELFVTSLLDALPAEACVLTWNKGFEGKVLRALATRFPNYRKRLLAICDNMVDLMALYRSKQIYHWQFDGSYSLKAVLPALVPELSYDNLAISDGGSAADSWLRMRATNDCAEQAQIRLDLLEYCHLDTLAMFRILEKMREMGDHG